MRSIENNLSSDIPPADMPGRLLVITGPSGVGKGTLCKRLKESLSNVVIAVSVTSRQARPGEVDGVDYFFVDRPTFEAMAEAGELLEWAEYNRCLYGTSRQQVMTLMEQGKTVLLEIEVQGALAIKKLFPQACLVFLKPPSLEALRARLEGRGQNNTNDIEARLAIGEQEIAQSHQFEHVFVNDDLDACYLQLSAMMADHTKVLDV